MVRPNEDSLLGEAMVDMTTYVAQAAARHGCARHQQVPLQRFRNGALEVIAEAVHVAPAVQGVDMSFELRVPGIPRERLTEIAGEQGPFYIATIGGKPELENGFFYGDDNNQFCFYANINVLEGKRYDIEVFDASSGRFSGSTPKSVGSHLATIKNNINKCFHERDFFTPSIPSTEADRENLRSVRFTWSVM
jgi:hypothetical protein